MKRMTRRSLAILLGLTLGWYAAGLMPGTSVTMAADGGTSTHKSDEHHDHDHDADHAPAATMLSVGPSQSPWLSSVLTAAAGLFAAAIVLGIPAMKLRGPEPVEPADHADDHHHDHGHDGHGAHGGHGH